MESHAAFYHGDAGWIVAIVLDFPGANSQGKRCVPRGEPTGVGAPFRGIPKLPPGWPEQPASSKEPRTLPWWCWDYGISTYLERDRREAIFCAGLQEVRRQATDRSLRVGVTFSPTW